MTTAVQKVSSQVPGPALQRDPNILASDVLIPRLLLMQGTSDFVKERKAQLGDMVRSTNAEKLGDPDTPINFIPLSSPQPTWIREARQKGAQRWEFRGIEKRDAGNDTLPWTFNADKEGILLPDGARSDYEWRRVKCLTLFAILPQDIDAFQLEQKKAAEGELPDFSKALAPIQFTFRSTGLRAGKEVTTYFTQAASFARGGYSAKPHAYSLKLECFLDTNDQGSYYVFRVNRDRPAKLTAEQLAEVEPWVAIVNSSAPNLKVDDILDAGEDAPLPGGTATRF